jgi:hypothetical protein
MPRKHPYPSQYSISINRLGGKQWTWEIKRTPPLGVRLYGENFTSAHDAKVAGERALLDLLNSIEKLDDDT